jgi:stage II sporulation protein D
MAATVFGLPAAPTSRGNARYFQKSTLRVGMWTLWHDREVTVTPAPSTMLQTCVNCVNRPLLHAIVIHAGDRTGVTIGRDKSQNSLRLSGGVTLTAHSETVSLHDPVEISGRDGTLILAVTMLVERYVEAVVASESGAADGPGSLKTLAVVVRSYALHEDHAHLDYDVCDSTHCQLLHWHGNPRSQAAHAATLATAGETLWFHGRHAHGFFSKDCGGRTASVSEVWPRLQSASYLESRVDPYCAKDSGGWTTELTRSELASALAAHGVAAPGWQHLKVDLRGPSGRVVALRLDEKIIRAEEFRIAVGESLGWDRIPSTWFEVNQQGDRIFFHGRGTGHGVGLCQKGSAAMSQQGRSAREILAQYFPGAEAADEATGKSWQTLSRAGVTLETLNASDAAFVSDLARARAEASQRSGLNAGRPLTVRAFASTPAFRDATLAPGWMAAFSEGEWIATQPLATLAARGLLLPTLRHEFLHALVEQEAGPHAPLWLREGLVELWSANPAAGASNRVPMITPDAVNAALAHPAGEKQSAAAHRDAAIYAARVMDLYGRAQAVEWLHSGIPSDALVRIGQR